MLNYCDFIQIFVFTTNHHLNEHLGKSVEELLNKFNTVIDQFSSQCIPSKLIRGKSLLPWITQEVMHMIHNQSHLPSL